MIPSKELRISILGTPEISAVRPGGVFPVKGYQLLGLLARAPGGRSSRRELASLLWDSTNDEASLANLRQLLARIRRAVPEGQCVLESDAVFVTLGADKMAIDLCLLQVKMEMPNPDISAIGLFRGDLLEGTEKMTDAFDHWLLRERTAVRERFFYFATALLLDLTRFGRASRADLSVVAGKLLWLEPEREASYRALLEAYGRNGMFDEAARVYAALFRALREDDRLAPSAETASVARRVFAWQSAFPAETGEPTERHPRPRVAFFEPTWQGAFRQAGLLRMFVEDIANELCRHRDFAVLAPHSSFAVDHNSGIPADNAVLRADYSVSGFLRPDSGGRTLSLRMVNCLDGELVWTADFRVDSAALTRSFSLISLRVASNLGAAIERDRVTAMRKACDPVAYVHYLDGQRLLGTLDLAHLRRARKSFRQSINDDERFAAPRARAAQTLYLEWLQLGCNDPHLLVTAREQADLALAIDPNDATGYWMKGTVALYQRDFEECQSNLAEAESLSPNSADLQLQYADALSHLGHADEGWTRFERAVELNPSPPDHYWWAGASIAFHQRNYQRAVDMCGKLQDEEPVLSVLAASYALLGDIETGRRYGARVRELFPGHEALEKSIRGTPDRLDIDRELRVEGLRLAGLF